MVEPKFRLSLLDILGDLLGEWKWSNLNKFISVCSLMWYVSVVMYSGWCYDYFWRKPLHQFIIAIDLWTFEETECYFLNLFLKNWYCIQTFIYKTKSIWNYFLKNFDIEYFEVLHFHTGPTPLPFIQLNKSVSHNNFHIIKWIYF